jgi:hypothetical protein
VSGTNPAREQLEQLVSPKTLAVLDEQVLALVTGESEPEPEPVPIFDAIAAAKETKRRTVVDVVLGRVQAPAAATGGLDGGARAPVPRTKTHEETVLDVLKSGEADAGAAL